VTGAGDKAERANRACN